MVVAAWVAKHTGLPSLRFPTTAGKRWSVPASDAAGRTWTAASGMGTGAEALFSDALAAPGVPASYTLPTGNAHTLTRAETEWWRGMVSGLDGRTVPDLAWEDAKDSREWSSSVKRFNARVSRWALEDEAVTGSATLTLFDPSRVDVVWAMLRAHAPLVVHPGVPTPLLPSRAVTVDKVAASRLADDVAQFSVSWSELPWDSPMLSGSGAPVVSWGEWQALDGGWAHRTYLELCQLVAGMPS